MPQKFSNILGMLYKVFIICYTCICVQCIYICHVQTCRYSVRRLLQKLENQYSDFYIQLAAHILLEVYQETGNAKSL